MDILLLVSISLITFSLLFAFNFLLKPQRLNLPPSPLFSLPLIGHFHLLKHPPHQALQTLSQKLGPVFSLRFGSRLAVIISSPSAVQECFTKNDIVLANRPLVMIGKYLAYNHTTMGVSPYGEHWRNLRRIGSLEIFSTSRINLFIGIREEEVKRLVMKLCTNDGRLLMEEFREVELEAMLLDLMFNIITRMVSGMKFYENEKHDSKEFRDMVIEIMAQTGATNAGDFIPLLNWINPSGFKKKIINLGQKSDELLQGLVDEIRNKKDGGNTMIHHLLRLQKSEPEYYSDQIIKGLVQIIFLAGIDTSAVTLEWALSHLLNNPKVLQKAKAEMDSIIGKDRMVNESDLSSLSYLQGIITETLRLSPPAPLLAPHCASEACKIEGYDVPRDTVVLINAWAIHRDPNLWDDATSFKPERHIGNVNIGSEIYKLIPFGLGRRACPGVGMAQRFVGLTLASLIQCFEWERVSSSLVDMAEGKGLTVPKAQPLVAKYKPRPIIKTIMSVATDRI